MFISRQRSCGKVMFSVMSVCHSVHNEGEGGPFTAPTPQCARPWPAPQTCSDLFNLDLTVGKQTVGTRLKYLSIFLRSVCFHFNNGTYMYIFKQKKICPTNAMKSMSTPSQGPNEISHCLCKFETDAIEVFTISQNWLY